MRILKPSIVFLAFTFSLLVGAQWNPYNTDPYQSFFSVTTGPGAIYAVSYGQGVIKSTDSGVVWNPSNTGLSATLSDIQSVYYNGTNLYCGTHQGVYRSTNAGANWSIANTGLPAASSSNYAKKFFKFGTTTFAIQSAQIGGGVGGVWRTTDNGDNWYSGNGGLSSNMIVYQIAAAGGTLYVATSVGIYTSTNLGISWSLFSNSNFATYGIQGTAARIVAITTFGYRYRNMQPTVGAWVDATGDPSTPTAGELILYDSKYWAMTGGGSSTILRSTDNGATYSAYTTGLQGADVIAQYCWHASGNTLFLGALGKLYGTPGTTTGVDEATEASNKLPVPYPTVFTDAFTVDLTEQPAHMELSLVDATGREVERRTDLPAAPVRFERGTLPAGTYRVLLIDGRKGTRSVLGAVIAQ